MELSVNGSPRADGGRALLQDTGGQWNFLRDDKIAGGNPFGNGIIGRVRSARNLDGAHMRQAWRGQEMIGDQGHCGAGAHGSSKQNVADHGRTGISIDPDLRLGWRTRRIHKVISIGKGPDMRSDLAR